MGGMNQASDTTQQNGSASQGWSSLEKSLLAGAILLITLSAFESLATTTIMPNIVADLRAEAWFSIASGASLVTQLVANVLAGGLSDALGPKKVLFWGFGLFAAGLLISAFSPTIALFVLGRLIQGMGGGFVIVPLYVLIGAVAAPEHRPRFFALFSLSWVLPALVGPAIAGLIVTYWGWRPVFGAAPFLALFGLIPLVSVLRKIPTHARGTLPSPRFTLLAVGAGIGVFLLQLSGTFTSLPAMAVCALAGCVLTAFTLPHMLPRGAFRLRRGIPSLVMTRFFAMGALTGADVLLPLILQRVHGWNANHASLAVTVATISWAVGSTAQARIYSQERRLRLPLVGGLMLTLGICPLLALLIPGVPIWAVLIAWSVAGTGMGLAHATISDLTLGQVDPAKHGRASSWLQVADSGGSAVELAIVSLAMALWSLTGAQGALLYLPACAVAIGACLCTLVTAVHVRPRS